MTGQRLTKLYLARHGESMANLQKRVSGQIDTPLSPKGKQQAQWLCDVLKNETLTAIFTSSLSRTIATAEPTAAHHRLSIQVKDGFKEMDFGARQGRRHQQISYGHTLYGVTHSSVSDDDGEPPAQFIVRVESALMDIVNLAQGGVLIVGHRKTNEMILSKLLKTDLTQLLGKPINVKNKYVYEILLGEPTTVNTIRLGGEHHGCKYAGLKDD